MADAQLLGPGQEMLFIGGKEEGFGTSWDAQVRRLDGATSHGPVRHDVLGAYRDGHLLTKTDGLSLGSDGETDDVTVVLDASRQHQLVTGEPGEQNAGTQLLVPSRDGRDIFTAVVPPLAMSAATSEVAVTVSGKGKELRVLMASGNDLLVVRPVPFRQPEGAEHIPYNFVWDRKGDHLLVAARKDAEDRLVGGPWVVAGRTNAWWEVPLPKGLERDRIEEAVLSDDGERVMLFNREGGWILPVPGLSAQARTIRLTGWPGTGTVLEAVALGGEVVVHSAGAVRRYDIGSGKPVGAGASELDDRCGWDCGIEPVPGSDTELALRVGQRIEIWNVKSSRQVNSVSPGDRRITSLRVGPDGRTAAVVTIDGSVTLWDLRAEEKLPQELRNANVESVIDFGPAGLLLETSAVGEPIFWSLNDTAHTLDLPWVNAPAADAWRVHKRSITGPFNGIWTSYPLSPERWLDDLCRNFAGGQLIDRQTLPEGAKETPPCS